LFFLPFQLVSQFGYYTIPGVAIAAFIYLGFIAAGEEIEQPFGYDDNDLDLDLICHAIIHADIKQLKSSPCLNAYFGANIKQAPSAPRRSRTLTEMTDQENGDHLTFPSEHI
jgi:predicted membrane chloride channel (bestrophin family)